MRFRAPCQVVSAEEELARCLDGLSDDELLALDEFVEPLVELLDDSRLDVSEAYRTLTGEPAPPSDVGRER